MRYKCIKQNYNLQTTRQNCYTLKFRPSIVVKQESVFNCTFFLIPYYEAALRKKAGALAMI